MRSRISLSKSRVRSGPYAYVRNPIQISGILLGIALLLYHPTLYMLAYLVDMAVVLVLFHLFENGEMEGRCGEEFSRYRASVRNWLPRLTPYRG